MNSRGRHSEGNTATEINISPLLDVIFILLIFFIVTMVFADNEAAKVDLPQAENSSTVNLDATVVIISESGEIFLDDKSYAISQIKLPLSKSLEKSNGVLIIKASSVSPVQRTVEVMDIAKPLGAKEIYLATEKK